MYDEGYFTIALNPGENDYVFGYNQSYGNAFASTPAPGALLSFGAMMGLRLRRRRR